MIHKIISINSTNNSNIIRLSGSNALWTVKYSTLILFKKKEKEQPKTLSKNFSKKWKMSGTFQRCTSTILRLFGGRESRLPVRFSRLGPRFPNGGRGCIQTSRLTRRKGSRGGLHYHPPALDSLFWGEGESSYLAFTRVQGSRECITRDFYGSNRGCPVLHPKDNLTCVLLHILYFLCAPSSLCTSLSPIRSLPLLGSFYLWRNFAFWIFRWIKCNQIWMPSGMMIRRCSITRRWWKF